MTSKESALHAIEELPDDASWEDILERVHFMAGVRRRLAELDAGKGIPHKEIRKEIAGWVGE
ncbi:MAG: hypothetical protein KC931_24840 [Candidatus Omnitrophica bacterium]|nr:hypothetical protein [Candidatus Omnitrophota bacterium]